MKVTLSRFGLLVLVFGTVFLACTLFATSSNANEAIPPVFRKDMKITELKHCVGGDIGSVVGGPGSDFFTLGKVNPMNFESDIVPTCIGRVKSSGKSVWQLSLQEKEGVYYPQMVYVRSADKLYVTFEKRGDLSYWLWAIEGKSGKKLWEKQIFKCHPDGSGKCTHYRLGQWGGGNKIRADSKGVVVGYPVGVPNPDCEFELCAQPNQSEYFGTSVNAYGFDHAGNKAFEIESKVNFLTDNGLALNLLNVDWANRTVILAGSRCLDNGGECQRTIRSYINQISFGGEPLWSFEDTYPRGFSVERYLDLGDSIGLLGISRSVIVGKDGIKKTFNPEIVNYYLPGFPNFVNASSIQFEDGSHGLLFGFGFNLFGAAFDQGLSEVASRAQAVFFNPEKFEEEPHLDPFFKLIPQKGNKWHLFSTSRGPQSADKGPKKLFFERILLSGKELNVLKREVVENTQLSKWISWSGTSYNRVAETENGDIIQHIRYLPEDHRESFGFLHWKD